MEAISSYIFKLELPNSVSEVVVKPSWTIQGIARNNHVFFVWFVNFFWAEDDETQDQKDYQEEQEKQSQRWFYWFRNHGETLLIDWWYSNLYNELQAQLEAYAWSAVIISSNMKHWLVLQQN